MRSWYYPGGSHLVLFAPDHIDIDYPVSAVPGYDLHGEFLRDKSKGGFSLAGRGPPRPRGR